MVEFLVASGARIGEVTALKPGDVDPAARTVWIARVEAVEQRLHDRTAEDEAVQAHHQRSGVQDSRHQDS